MTTYPEPTIPASALLDFVSHGTGDASKYPSILNFQNTLFTTSGRSAIALALEHANITTGDEVLIPAYHCEAMIAPARWREAKAVFYRINSDASIQLDDIKKKITPKTKAIIVTHYFGFEQQLQDVKEICINLNIVLIEDCAHALFGLSSGRAIGRTGDYATASCMKFLPIYDGGLLCSTSRDISNLKLTPPALLFQFKSVINGIEKALRYGRLGQSGRLISLVLLFKDKLWQKLKLALGSNINNRIGPASSDGNAKLEEHWIHKSMTIFSYLITKNTNLEYIAEQRRKNYKTLYQSLKSLPNCRPLFSELPDYTVPWMFPLYVEQPEIYVKKMKTRGIPVRRFGELLDPSITKDICPVSIEYSKHVIQLPCHQSLTENEIDWISKTIKNIFL